MRIDGMLSKKRKRSMIIDNTWGLSHGTKNEYEYDY